MDKKTLLAVLLILVVFWLSSEFIWKRKAIQTQQETTTENVIQASNQIAEPNDLNSTPLNETEITVLDNDIDINNNIVLENELIKLKFSHDRKMIGQHRSVFSVENIGICAYRSHRSTH